MRSEADWRVKFWGRRSVALSVLSQGRVRAQRRAESGGPRRTPMPIWPHLRHPCPGRVSPDPHLRPKMRVEKRP